MSELFERTVIAFVNDTFTPEPLSFTASIEENTDMEGARETLLNMVRCGWQISTVHAVTNYDYKNEHTAMKLDTVEAIMDVTEHLIENEYNVSRILGYGECFGWDADEIVGERWNDAIYYEGDSPADVAQEVFYEMHPDLMLDIEGTITLSIDWEHTAEQLRHAGATFHNRNGVHMMFDGI